MSAQKAHQHGYQLDDGGIPRQQLRMRLRRLAAHHAARPTVAAAPRRPVAEARVLKSTESSGRAAPTWPVPDVSIAMSQRGTQGLRCSRETATPWPARQTTDVHTRACTRRSVSFRHMSEGMIR